LDEESKGGMDEAPETSKSKSSENGDIDEKIILPLKNICTTDHQVSQPLSYLPSPVKSPML
jgi:hypothetical protein